VRKGDDAEQQQQPAYAYCSSAAPIVLGGSKAERLLHLSDDTVSDSNRIPQTVGNADYKAIVVRLSAIVGIFATACC